MANDKNSVICCSKHSPLVIWRSKQSTEQHLLSLICWPSLVAHWTFNLIVLTIILINLVSWMNSSQTCHHPFLSRVKVLVGLGQSPVAGSDRSGSSPCPSKWAWIVLLLFSVHGHHNHQRISWQSTSPLPSQESSPTSALLNCPTSLALNPQSCFGRWQNHRQHRHY